ncbi:MAG: hypothetical protein WCL42_03295 [Chlorobiaceae bacterium]
MKPLQQHLHLPHLQQKHLHLPHLQQKHLHLPHLLENKFPASRFLILKETE